jgi:RNA polymerase sigma-70 factor (ECF subfamily)
MDELTPLARAAARGDHAALAALVQRTQEDVWRLCAHLVDPASADDLAQETFLRAIPALGKFRGDAPVRTWLLAIARRACAAEIGTRSRNRQLAARLAAMPPGALGQQEPEPGAQAAAGLLVAALEPDRRAAFVLTQMLGCSYAEAAAICDCPIGTIRSRVARAREDLIAMTADPQAPARAEISLQIPRQGFPDTPTRFIQYRPGVYCRMI